MSVCDFMYKVGRCKLKLIETRLESAWFQRLKLKYNSKAPVLICLLKYFDSGKE